MTPDAFLIEGKAWIEAVSGVLDLLIAKLGLLALAVIALWQNINAKALIAATKERLDRQGDKINQVALATAQPTEVKVINPDSEPVPTDPV